MTVACTAPDTSLGVAVRVSSYLDCQARALGENGFQALAGGPLVASLVSGLVTIFVALIGYRLILGATPGLRDGVGWAVRLGVVLILMTSWPAFQTLVYNVAVDGPNEIAAILVPAAGLSVDALDGRVQSAYDDIRQGAFETRGDAVNPAAPPSSSPVATPTPTQGQSPTVELRTGGRAGAPQIATVLVLSTTGLLAALRMAIGFLLAIAPLVLLSLLFETTSIIAGDWARVLASTAIALVAASVVTAIALLMVEGELARSHAFAASSMLVDEQAVPTIVMLFALVQLVTLLVVGRIARSVIVGRRSERAARHPSATSTVAAPGAAFNGSSSQTSRKSTTETSAQSRSAAIAGALTRQVQLERLGSGGVAAASSGTMPRNVAIADAARLPRSRPGSDALGTAARRTSRRSLSATARDRVT